MRLKHWNKNNLKDWDNKIRHACDGGLLQSLAWGNFQESLGNAVYNVSNEQSSILAQCVILKAGSQFILNIPRGPVILSGSVTAKDFSDFFLALRAFAREKGCFLIRLDPPFTTGSQQEKMLRQIKFAAKAPRDRNPVHTLIINTTPQEEELLKQMKPKWRYNIGVAQKKGVTVQWDSSFEAAKVFASLMKKTTSRQKFAGYDEGYFSKLVRSLGNNSSFILAKHENRVVAGLLIGFFGDHAYYLHGGSDYEYRSLMAPHLLQWEAIKESKKRGCSYDFWGVAGDPPIIKQETQWRGITRFKKGFSPQTAVTEYTGCYEIAVKKTWFWLYKIRALFK